VNLSRGFLFFAGSNFSGIFDYIKKKTMKKFILLPVFVIAMAGVSCKKDRTCVCTDSGGNTVGTVVIHDTKSKATTACTQNNNSLSGVTCSLK
jgi:hypothetical protein